MHDVDRALDEIGRFASRPPTAPRGRGEIEERAAMRRRRTRVRGAGLVAACLAAVALTAVALVGGDGGREVRVTTRPDTTTTAEPGPPTTGNPLIPVDGLSVVPDTGLEPGQVVTVTGPLEFDLVTAWAVCASEADEAADPTAWCDINVVAERRADALELTVVRVIATSNGLVDCAAAPARCLVGVRTADGRTLSAPISFRPDLPPIVDPAIELSNAALTDGGRTEIRLSGYAPGTEVWLAQCLGDDSVDWDDWRQPLEHCDVARTMSVTVDGAGRGTADYLAFAEIQTYDGWMPCEPCMLVATAMRQPAVGASLEVRAVAAPIRPEVRIEPDGPYDRGQRVRLVGTGFQASAGSSRISPGWCAFRTGSPETEIQGDPRNGYTSCAYPSETAFGVLTDERGGFVVESYPLPDGPFGSRSSGDCAAPELRCGLAWHPGEGTLPAFVTLFDLR